MGWQFSFSTSKMLLLSLIWIPSDKVSSEILIFVPLYLMFHFLPLVLRFSFCLWFSASVCVCVCARTHVHIQAYSVQFSHSVMSDSLRPHESQHARPPCLSPTPRVHSNACPSSRWCHPAISSSVVPFSSCPQSLPASESFPMSQLFTWGGQTTGVSASASFPQRNPRADLLQNGLVGSPCSPRDSQESSPTPQFKSINSSALSFLPSPTLTSIHDHGKNHSLD